MAGEVISELEQYFEREVDDDLRSIVRYEPDGFEVLYARDDLADQYSERELKRAIDDLRMESFAAPIYQDVLSEDHGDLISLVKAFENVIEMNFALGDGIEVSVALEDEAMAETSGLVAGARAIALEAQS